MHVLPTLPYSYAALEPLFDAQTMEIHHTKHHQTYVDKLNAALKDVPALAEKPVEQLLREFSQVPAELQTAVKNHGGGHANHSLWWSTLGKTTEAPAGELAAGITQLCSSFETFKEHFTTQATGLFGSGWTWLVVNPDKSLEIKTTPNQDSPLMSGVTPIMGLDVWEHAYYLKYQNKRPDYVVAFWSAINWTEVEKRYLAAVQ